MLASQVSALTTATSTWLWGWERTKESIKSCTWTLYKICKVAMEVRTLGAKGRHYPRMSPTKLWIVYLKSLFIEQNSIKYKLMAKEELLRTLKQQKNSSGIVNYFKTNMAEHIKTCMLLSERYSEKNVQSLMQILEKM